MNIEIVNDVIIPPRRNSEHAAGFDIYMPVHGTLLPNHTRKIKLGFKTEIPVGYAALLMPRSSAGGNGLVLTNTIGLIDSDYRGEWAATLHNRGDNPFSWLADDRIIQFILVPVLTPELTIVAKVEDTVRGEGGFGSTGQ